MHKLVIEAMHEINAWVENGCPDESYFLTHTGICNNVEEHLDAEAQRTGDWETQDGMADFEALLSEKFGDAGYPFNNGDSCEYSDEDNKYSNPRRLEFIRWFIKEYPQ